MVSPISSQVYTRPQRKRVQPDYYTTYPLINQVEKKSLKKRKVIEDQLKPWAHSFNTPEGIQHTFSNGFQVIEKKKDFARVITGAPIIFPEVQHDTSDILKEIQTRGFSVVRMMQETDAKNISEALSMEYRELLRPNKEQFIKENPDIDLDLIELTELPEKLYGGRAGSGKLNSNGFTQTNAAWEIRSRVCEIFQKLYQDLSGKKEPVMTTGQFILAWGPNLVNSLEREEKIPRFFPHIDYYGTPISAEKIDFMHPGVQSLVVVTPPDVEQDLTATLVFPNSHHYFGEIQKRKTKFQNPEKGGIPIALLVDMVNEGKILPPVRVFIPQGCALSWSRQLVHSPHSGRGKRVGLPVTVLPTRVVSLNNRIKNVLFYLTSQPSLGVEADGEIRYHALYSRRGSKIYDKLGWTRLSSVKETFIQLAKKRTGKELRDLGFEDLKKHFTNYEIANSIDDKKMASLLGVEQPEEFL